MENLTKKILTELNLENPLISLSNLKAPSWAFPSKKLINNNCMNFNIHVIKFLKEDKFRYFNELI
jgi:hypothetical protein